MSVTNHTITVTVDGIDKSTSLAKDSVYIRFQLNRRANTAELKFLNYEPVDRATVQVSIDGTVVFGGYITRKSASIQGLKSNPIVTWSCECKDWSELFETVTVSSKQYTNQEDRAIILDLFSSFMPFDAGFVFNSTKTVKLSVTTTFENVSLKDALDQLAKISGANWYVKPNKDFYWFTPVTPDHISYIISSTPNGTTKFGFQDGSLTYDLDSSTIVNQVKFVSGVRSTGSKTFDTFTGDGTTKKFTLARIPDSILSCSYNDGTANYVTYGSFVGQAPSDKLISKGGTKTVVVDSANQTIELEGNTGLAPANSTSIQVEYYYREKIDFTVDDPYSQEEFGLFPYTVKNKEIDNPDNLQALAESMLEQNSYAKPSIRFDTTQYGLMPGLLLQLDIPELGFELAPQVNRLLSEDRNFGFGLENGAYVLREQSGIGRSFIIQEVSLQPVVTPNGFMIVSKVTCGKWTGTLVDSLSSLAELKSGIDRQPAPIPTRLSNVSSDLGEVVIGRANFTDGGTAPFNWGTPNGASGVVVGLEDRTSTQGAVYIYDSGTVRAKLGNMTGLPTLGTVTPSGWGLYTENGYFSGVVAASHLIGGTINGFAIIGNQISGGTITGNYISGGTIAGGWIDGGTIQSTDLIAANITGVTINSGVIYTSVLNGNLIQAGTVIGTRITGGSIVGNTIIGGTIATGTPPINSSNPGVYLDSTGLYGYGSAGLTFRLSSDPAIKPWFSSGTILDTTYEINTSAVLRTGTTNPRVQIDNSGIFAYDSGGNLKFSVASATGLMSAVSGSFSGNVTASSISGGTITGVAITANTLSGNSITGGTITSGVLNSGTINSSIFNTSTFNTGTINSTLVQSGTIVAPYISGGTVYSGVIHSNQVYGGTVTGALISGNTVSGGTITGGYITGGTVTGALVTGNTVSGGTVTGALVSGGTVTGAIVNSAGGSISISDSGLIIKPGSSYTYDDARSIRFRNASNVTQSEIGGNSTGYLSLTAGKYTVSTGILEAIVNDSASPSNYSFYRQNYNQYGFWINNVSKFSIFDTFNMTSTNLLPYDTASNLQLGDSTHGFRYLYLKDDNGNVRRVSINSSGVLTVT